MERDKKEISDEVTNMVKSEVRKATVKKKAKSRDDEYITWTTKLKRSQAAQIDAIIKSNSMSRAGFIRWAAGIT